MAERMPASGRTGRDGPAYDGAMLSASYRWTFDGSAAFLDYNAGNVASVRQVGGKWQTRIQWAGHIHIGPCGSMEQGRRFIERWVEKRSGPPGLLAKGPRWYDDPQRERRAIEAVFGGAFSPGIAVQQGDPYHARLSGIRTGSRR
jgi:hypothetical protein